MDDLINSSPVVEFDIKGHHGKYKDYYFVSEQDFKRLIKNEEFLEYAKVFDNFYGTTRTPVIDKLNKSKNVLFDIDWQGADQIKNKGLDYKLITFFILPPSKEVLFERLSKRHDNDKLLAEERMKQFDKDVLHWKDYDYVIINSDLEVCYKQISNYIDCEINKKKSNYEYKFKKIFYYFHKKNLTHLLLAMGQQNLNRSFCKYKFLNHRNIFYLYLFQTYNPI